MVPPCNPPIMSRIMNRRKLQIELATPESTARWLMNKELLYSNMACSRCGMSMSLQAWARSVDGFMWRCSKDACGKPTTSIRIGSIFATSHLSLVKIFNILYEWAMNTPQKRIECELEISNKTALKWARACRSVVAFYFEKLDGQKMIGGPGTVLEVDKTLVAKRKYNVGRLVEQQWLFRGIILSALSTSFECFLELVPDRSRETLHEVLKRACSSRNIHMQRHLGRIRQNNSIGLWMRQGESLF